MFTLSKAILFRSIGTGHLMDNALGKEVMFEFITIYKDTHYPHHSERLEE
jgi:hypothetical protein